MGIETSDSYGEEASGTHVSQKYMGSTCVTRSSAEQGVWNRFARASTSVPFLVFAGSLILGLGLVLDELLITLALLVLGAVVAGLTLSRPEPGLGYHHIQSLDNLLVRKDSDYLVQETRAGLILARIDLRQKYDISIPHIDGKVSVIRVSQDSEELDFPSTLPEAEYIWRDCLGQKTWPPIERTPYSF